MTPTRLQRPGPKREPWRGPWPMSALGHGVVLGFCLAGGPGTAFGAGAAPGLCGAHLAAPARQVAEQGALTVVFAPRPWPVPVGQHFALDIAVCAAHGTAVPASLRVDADMPAHRHGMNYKPTVQALGGGRFVAEGLMFHMPGRWRLRFYPPTGAPVALEIDTP